MKLIFTVFAIVLFLPYTVRAGQCDPTPMMSTGTHYEPVTTYRVDVSTGLLVEGKILSSSDCKPITNVRVEHWQTSREGRYEDRLRAYLFSDDNGYYRFNTEWPASRAPHIHFIVYADGYKTLETQWRGREVVEKIKFDMVLEKLAH